MPEDEVSDSAKDVFPGRFPFYHSTGIQALGCLIPGKNGTIKPGQRLFNWVRYCKYEDSSAELEELMADIHGKRHAITLPVGSMNPKV